MGADVLIDPFETPLDETIAELTDGIGPDVVIEAVGSVPTYEAAVAVVRRGGRILAYGAAPQTATMSLRPFDIYSKELTIVGSYAGTYDTWPRAIALLAEGRFTPSTIVDSIRPLSEAVEAIRALEHGQVHRQGPHPDAMTAGIDPSHPNRPFSKEKTLMISFTGRRNRRRRSRRGRAGDRCAPRRLRRGSTAVVRAMTSTLNAIFLPAAWGTVVKEQLAPQYEEETGVKVNVELIGRDAIHEKMATLFAGQDSSYDIFNLDYNWIPEFGEGGHLVPLDDASLLRTGTTSFR